MKDLISGEFCPCLNHWCVCESLFSPLDPGITWTRPHGVRDEAVHVSLSPSARVSFIHVFAV